MVRRQVRSRSPEIVQQAACNENGRGSVGFSRPFFFGDCPESYAALRFSRKLPMRLIASPIFSIELA